MRKLIYGAAVSLDGFLAGPDDAMDWLRWSEEAAAISSASWVGVDTMLMGRKTYDFARRSGGSKSAIANIRTIVFSRTLDAAEGAELVRSDAAAFVMELKASEGGTILVMGGGELGTALLEAGLIDEVGLNIHPLLLGSGARMFGSMQRRIELELIEARPIARDCLFARYRVLS